MADSPENFGYGFVAHVTAQVVETVLELGQENVHVLASSWGTDRFEAVVGQREMGQATQMQVTLDSFEGLHLVRAEP